MKYGIREICDVVLKAKSKMIVGNKTFYKDEPVIYFDSLKTSTLEGAATTVYAQGGRGNARLIAWEGERTVTFTMEDALISTLGLAILTGAGVVDASEAASIIQHVTEQVQVGKDGTITLKKEPYQNGDEHLIYVMILDDNGNPSTEPYIYKANGKELVAATRTTDGKHDYRHDANAPKAGDVVLVDYYVERKSGAQQIEITADKFGGNFYLEASTLFRDTNGVDMPAEFVIPNCKVQSNFTFAMSSSGDPSTFTSPWMHSQITLASIRLRKFFLSFRLLLRTMRILILSEQALTRILLKFLLKKRNNNMREMVYPSLSFFLSIFKGGKGL